MLIIINLILTYQIIIDKITLMVDILLVYLVYYASDITKDSSRAMHLIRYRGYIFSFAVQRIQVFGSAKSKDFLFSCFAAQRMSRTFTIWSNNTNN